MAKRDWSRNWKTLAPLLTHVTDAEQLATIGEWIVECATGTELLEQVRQRTQAS
jgi:hypothetical protein